MALQAYYPSSDVVRAALGTAIATAYDRERKLFNYRANERSLIFHIGRYLAAEVAAWDVGLSVDLEYNRWNRGPLEVVRTKYLKEFNPDGRDRNVLPDLIVHNRSGSSHEHNILVLEAKHSPSEKDREFDYRKLIAFRQEFFYQQAVFLEFPRRGAVPCWQWITDERPDPCHRPPRAI